MIGDVRTKAFIEGEIKTKATLVGDISSRCLIGEIEIGRVVIKRYETEEYEGAYAVTPTVENQTLETANKRLLNDIEIQAIPYYDVSNEYGRTIYIGGEI